MEYSDELKAPALTTLSATFILNCVYAVSSGLLLNLWGPLSVCTFLQALKLPKSSLQCFARYFRLFREASCLPPSTALFYHLFLTLRHLNRTLYTPPQLLLSKALPSILQYPTESL